MTVLVNSFEGGSNTTVITTGNSGGASGNAFDFVSGAPSPTFSSTQAAHGSLSCEVSATSNLSYFAWTTSLGTQTTVYFRHYFYIPANPGGITYLTKFTQPGIATCASLMLNPSGTLAFWDTNGVAQITSTESVPLNAWFRVEGFVTGNASTGQVALNIYNSMDSRIATETHTSAATLNTFGTISGFDAGLPTSTTFTYYIDDIGISTQGFLGPYGSPPLTNTFEGGTNGTTITTGNSGGASGNAFDVVNLGTGATNQFSNTVSAHGTLSAEIATSSTAAQPNVTWTTSMGIQTQVWFRQYLYFTAFPGINFRVCSLSDSGEVNGAFLRVASNGTLQMVNLSTLTTITTSAHTIPLNQWFRVEGFVTAGTANGQTELRLFDSMDSIVPTEINTSSASLNLGTSSLALYILGICVTAASIGPFWMDDIGLSSTGYLGPSNTAIVYPQAGPVQAKGNGLPQRGRVSSCAGSVPALLLQNSFNGGTNGTTISAANSGGASGNAFNFVSIGASATATFSNAELVHGSLSGEFSTGASAVTSLVQWSASMGIQSEIWFRFYAFFTANPSATTRIFHLQANGGVNGIASVNINTAGAVTMLDGQANLVLTSANKVPLNQWFRIEGFVVGSPAQGQLSFSLFDSPDAQIPIETDTSSAAHYTYGPINIAQFGVVGAVANVGPFWLDNLGISNTGYLGPASLTSAPSLGYPVQAKQPLPIRGRTQGTVPKIIQLTNNFNNGTSGATVTTGNSGSSGNAFDSTNIAAGQSLTYSSNFSAHGALSCAIATTTGTTAFYGQYTTSMGTQSTIWFRVYCYLPVSSTLAWTPFFALSGSTHAGSFYFQTNRTIHTSYGSGFIDGPTFTTPVPINQWFRIEGYVYGNATNGGLSVSLFTPMDSAVPVETRSISGINTVGPLTQYRFGQESSITNAGPFYLDDIGISNAGYLGPSGLPSGAVFTPQQYPIRAKGNGLPPRGRIGSNPGSLPALLLLNDFDGGSNGTTISTANSGGVSGNSFNTVTIGAGATLTYSNSEWLSGTLSANFTQNGGSVNNFLRWDSSLGIQNQFWFRAYYYFTSYPNVNITMLRPYGAGGIPNAIWYLTTTGKIQLNNAAGSFLAATNNSIPLGQWFRVEGYFLGSPNAGILSVSIFSGSSQIPIEVLTRTGVNTASPITSIRFGVIAEAYNGSFYLDSVGISNQGYIGPVSYTADPSTGMPGSVVAPRIPQNGPRGRVASNPGALVPVLLTNSFEGGTNGVTISTANSGGASGQAFDSVSIGPSAVLVYSSTTYATGSLSAQFITPGSATFDDLQWSNNSIGIQPKIWFRICCFFPANPASNNIIFRTLTNNASTASASLKISTSGKVIVDNTGGTDVLTSVNSIPLNQWFRVEGFFFAPSAGGLVSFSLFSTPVAQIPIETQIIPTSTAGPADTVRFGVVASSSNLSFYLDSIGISSTGYLGPVSFPGRASSGFPGTSHQSRYKLPVRGRVTSNVQKATAFIPPVLRSLTFNLGLPYTQWTAGSATTQWQVP